MTEAPDTSSLIHLVESDVRVREPVKRLLTGRGWRVRAYASLPLLVERCGPDAAGCILLGRCDSDPDGWSASAELARGGVTLPVVALATHGGVSWMVPAPGASEAADAFLERTDYRDGLLDRLRRAVARDAGSRGGRRAGADGPAPDTALTSREVEVSGLLAAGLTSKETGRVIGISHRTVDVHRANIANKRAAASRGDDPT